MDIYSLERFADVQTLMYPRALREVQNGRKVTHWMWYIFPQLRALGRSATSRAYGIADADEARRFLAHELFGARLREISNALLTLDTNDPVSVFGAVDAVKLRSSMTLFELVCEEEGSVFSRVLDKFYGGERDALTEELLQNNK